jgi:hypothetical protein
VPIAAKILLGPDDQKIPIRRANDRKYTMVITAGRERLLGLVGCFIDWLRLLLDQIVVEAHLHCAHDDKGFE